MFFETVNEFFEESLSYLSKSPVVLFEGFLFKEFASIQDIIEKKVEINYEIDNYSLVEDNSYIVLINPYCTKTIEELNIVLYKYMCSNLNKTAYEQSQNDFHNFSNEYFTKKQIEALVNIENINNIVKTYSGLSRINNEKLLNASIETMEDKNNFIITFEVQQESKYIGFD